MADGFRCGTRSGHGAAADPLRARGCPPVCRKAGADALNIALPASRSLSSTFPKKLTFRHATASTRRGFVRTRTMRRAKWKFNANAAVCAKWLINRRNACLSQFAKVNREYLPGRTNVLPRVASRISSPFVDAMTSVMAWRVSRSLSMWPICAVVVHDLLRYAHCSALIQSLTPHLLLQKLRSPGTPHLY
jgi:hypothetical protein